MGLDIYFYKRKFNRHDPNLPTGKDENGENTYEELKDVAYFRKVNFLMTFFNYFEKCEADGNEGNCHYVSICDEEIEELIEACEETLKMEKKILEDLKNEKEIDGDLIPLKPCEGFFFGSTDLDEWFFEDVREVKKTFTNVRKDLQDDEELFMYVWW